MSGSLLTYTYSSGLICLVARVLLAISPSRAAGVQGCRVLLLGCRGAEVQSSAAEGNHVFR